MATLHSCWWVTDLSLGPDKIAGPLDNCDGLLSFWGCGSKTVWAGQFTQKFINLVPERVCLRPACVRLPSQEEGSTLGMDGFSVHISPLLSDQNTPQ